MKSVIVLCALAMSASVAAEEWVSVGAAPEVAPANSSEAPASPLVAPQTPQTRPSGNNASLVNELLMQIEQMQQEMSELRDRVEQQGNLITELRQDSDNRYLDLDRRIVFLTTEAEQQPAVANSTDDALSSPEQDYDAAMQLVRNQEFEQAAAAYDSFIKQYPEHVLVANAHYWKGEIAQVLGDLDEAARRFRTVIDSYPDHIKVPDATYKYAVILHRQGNDAEARQWLQKVIDEYEATASGTVSKARTYLQKISVNP